MLTCKQTDEFLDAQMGRSPVPVPAALQMHLDACERCRRLFATLSAEIHIPSDAGPVSRQIASRLTQGLTPVKPLCSTPVSAVRLITVFLLITATLLGGMGISAARAMTTLQLGAMLLVGAAGILALALSLSWQIAPGARHCCRPVYLLTGLLSVTVLCFLVLFPWSETAPGFAGGWHCARSGIALAIPAGILLWFTIRRGEPLALPTLGASVGGAAALVAVLILQFNCPQQEAMHLTVWHAGILVAGIGLGTLAGWLCQLWRERSFS
jgi:hypothetical protein